MAHTQAAMKALRQTKKRTVRNAAVKKTVSYLRKAALKAVKAKDLVKAQELSAKLVKAVDKAAQRNIIPKNAAARKKSRLALKINALRGS